MKRFDRMGRGTACNPPPWLKQIDANPASGQALYEVIRPAADGGSIAATGAMH
jgi:hypothetical protein